MVKGGPLAVLLTALSQSSRKLYKAVPYSPSHCVSHLSYLLAEQAHKKSQPSPMPLMNSCRVHAPRMPGGCKAEQATCTSAQLTVYQLTSIQAALGLMHMSGMTHVMMSPKMVLPRKPDC